MPSGIETSDRQTSLKNLKSGSGRRWGSKNKIPLDLKRAIIDAASAWGSDSRGTGGLTGYLFHLADRHPRAFAGLLQKLLPLQLDANLHRSVVVGINVVSIPSNHFVGPDDIAKLLQPREIEGDAVTIEPEHQQPDDGA